jgi:hypothetical protein
MIFASCAQPSTTAKRAVVQSALGQAPPTAGESAPVTKRARLREATVYVDGNPIAVLRAMEVPPSIKTHAMATLSGSVDRYLVGEYLGALGVDLAKVRAIHFHGGSRLAVIDGVEARRVASTLSFEFAGGDRGKPRMHFPAGVAVNTTVDMISAMTVYVDKEPPIFHDDGASGFLSFADGVRIDGIPYAPEEQLKGTRVYVDGVLVSTLKRKTLPNKLLLDGVESSPARFSLSRWLESVGVDTDGARAIDLVSGDDLVRRIEASDWAREQSSSAFVIPAHSHGQLAVDVPKTDGQKAKISAIQVFTKISPPHRWLAPPEFVVMSDEPQTSEKSAANEKTARAPSDGDDDAL